MNVTALFKILSLEKMAFDLKTVDRNTSRLRFEMRRTGLRLRYSEFHPSLCTRNCRCKLWPLLISHLRL